MQKLQDSLFSILKATSLSPAVFDYLQPIQDFGDKTPLGGILSDTKYGWLAFGSKFCVVDLRTGLKIAAWTFGASVSNLKISVTSVVELPTPLTPNSKQLIISLECDNITGVICVFHINGSQILRCIQTEVVVTKMAVCKQVPDGPLRCFDGVVMAGTKSGEIFAFDLNKSSLLQALKDISQGNDNLVRNELNMVNVTFLPLNSVQQIVEQREIALENDDHIAVLLNETSLIDGQYLFQNPDGTIRMKAKRDHIRVSTLQYIPQLGSLAVGFNFGAFQLWNLMTLDLELTSQVNVECLPVTHFGFQEPCDDPRAFCYLWVVYSVIDRFEEEEFPLAVMYSLTYQAKRMLSDTKYLYQDFLTSNIRFQVELSAIEGVTASIVGGRCVSCHTYSVNSILGEEGEDSMLNICQLVWECWGENANSVAQYGMLLFDLDQWYKDQMPATTQLQSNTFISATSCTELSRGEHMLDVRLLPKSVVSYSHSTRLEEHFYPNSLQYSCVCLSTSEACVLHTVGVQRQTVRALAAAGSSALCAPARLYGACVAAGLTPLYVAHRTWSDTEEQRNFLLSVALEARLCNFLKRCAHDWATGTHSGCTLSTMVNWAWKRALELKQNTKELTAPLFTSSSLPDRNVVRCLEHSVRQLTELTYLLDSILTKCCNLVVPDALSEIEEKFKGIGTVSLYFQALQWFLGVGLLPERQESPALSYPAEALTELYQKRRLKLHRLQENAEPDDDAANKSCDLLYIDQLIDHECGGEVIHEMWRKGGSENGLYPPPSLYSLLRIYLLPDLPQQSKHSLVLYLLVDYSSIYEHVRYESVIRRLMQFPTMFGLSNTAIKATQAFWHLDHRDFDFALDQLQCLTGNTLSDWQHKVVLSALLAQKKSQAALQYLHVRKPAPIQNIKDMGDSLEYKNNRVNDYDKLDDWQSCCSLYLARGLVFEALDVIRMCAQNAGSVDDKLHVLNFFFKACRNTGQLSKMLQISMQPFEEEVFIRFLENCNDARASDILIMYFLQQARYIEAQQHNNKMKQKKVKQKSFMSSQESILSSGLDRESTRETLVEIICSSLPTITTKVAHYALHEFDSEPPAYAPKPLSVYVQANSPKNMFTYKSSFIQNTLENASETWMNKPTLKRGLKRALNIEDTPFLCTPKLNRNKSMLTQEQDMSTDGTPPKRPKLDLSGTPKTPKLMGSAIKVSDKLNKEMQILLEMPDVQTPPHWKIQEMERSGMNTPQSILKVRRSEAASPIDSRYLADTDDEMMETTSQFSDSKHLRFTIPTSSEAGSTPSPTANMVPSFQDPEKEQLFTNQEKATDRPSFATSSALKMEDSHHLQSPPKNVSTEEVKSRKSYKDSVRSRLSHSISANSSLSEDPSTSIESIADIPITLINPRYSGEGKRYPATKRLQYTFEGPENESEIKSTSTLETKEHVPTDDDNTIERSVITPPKVPQARRSIRSTEKSFNTRSRSVTPDRQDSPITTPASMRRLNRSRSRTPDVSPSSLASIPELPKQEVESEPHAEKNALSVPWPLRSRSRSHTPERVDKTIKESPRLEAITESPTKPESEASTIRRSLRSRSRTPEVDPAPEPAAQGSPRSLRSRSKTPDREKLLSPIEKPSKSRKSLSRMVLENNAFSKTKPSIEVPQRSDLCTTKEKSLLEDQSDSTIECTPIKQLNTPTGNLLDATFSPIVNKSVLESSVERSTQTPDCLTPDEGNKSLEQKSLPAFTTISETFVEKSILQSYQSSIANETNESLQGEIQCHVTQEIKITEKKLDDLFGESNLSVLKDVSSLLTSDSDYDVNNQSSSKEIKKSNDTFEKSIKEASQNIDNLLEKNANIIRNEKQRIVEIEREINEIEGEFSDNISDSDDQAIASDESVNEMEQDSNDDEEEVSSNEGENEDDDSNTEEEVSNESNFDIISIDDSSDEVPSSSSSENRLQIDDQSNSDSNQDLENVDQLTPEAKIAVEVQVETEESTNQPSEIHDISTVTDPLNQEAVTEITGDNLILDSDKLPLNEIQPSHKNSKAADSALLTSDSFNQAGMSMLTDDNSVLESDHSDVSLNYSDEGKDGNDAGKLNENRDKQANSEKVAAMQVDIELESPSQNEIQKVEQKESVTTDMDVVDAIAVTPELIESKSEQKLHEKEKQEEELTEKTVSLTRKRINSTSSNKSSKEALEKTGKSDTHKLISDETTPRKRTKANSSKKDLEISKDKDILTANPSKIFNTDEHMQPVEEEDEAPSSVKNSAPKKSTRKRTKSNSSNISSSIVETAANPSETSKTDEEMKPVKEQDKAQKSVTIGAAKTPTTKRTKSKSSDISSSEPEKFKEIVQTTQMLKPDLIPTRKRSVSTSSNKSETKTSPENTKIETPSRTRAKTPTNTEVRRIMTRRASKELSESKIMDDSKELDESLTPQRRSTRSRSKNIDDNASITSESSVKSTRSKASYISDDGDRPAAVRKTRKSAMTTKPELSVIPEISTEDGTISKTDESDIINEYSNAQRLTRHQKAMLESWLEAKPSLSHTSIDDNSSVASQPFDVQPIDRISLLNKGDFEGPPDETEGFYKESPESIESDASKQQRLRRSRAASESKTTPKVKKTVRRGSVDVVNVVTPSGEPSLGRPRRASFTRAREAITTPKGRRPSTDTKKSDSVSGRGSPASEV